MTLSSEDLPELRVGQVVKVFPTGPASPTWFYDAVTGKCTDVCSAAEFEVGRVQAVKRGRHPTDHWYQVTVLKRGRVLYVNWLARWWIRLPHEGSPHEEEK